MNITLDEIRSNAPDGATHYEVCDGEVYYYTRTENLVWAIWNDCDDPFDPWWDSCIIGFNESKIKPL